MTLAREARQQGWWAKYEDLKMDPYLGLEAAAAAITSYTMYYIPALLQTEEYAKEIIKTIAPKMDPQVLLGRVEARMRRQERLDEDDPPRYRVLLDEAVLYRAVGGAAVMAAQLDKVLQAERRGKVTVQVVSFDSGAHAAQDSNFILFEFENTDQAPVVSVEGLTGMQYLAKSADITRYQEAIEYLRDSALSPRDSIALVAERQRAYAGKITDQSP